MPYTTVSRVENGRSLLEYILQEKGHNGNAVRNMMKSSVAMNDNEDYGTQMDRYWRRARSNHKVQIIHIIGFILLHQKENSKQAHMHLG